MNKKKYRAIICGLAAMAASVSFSVTPAYADSAEDAAAVDDSAVDDGAINAVEEAKIARAVELGNGNVNGLELEKSIGTTPEEAAREVAVTDDKVAELNAEAAKADAAAKEQEQTVDANDSRSVWLASRPTDEAVSQWMNAYNGKTIVAVNLDGVTEDIERPVNVAIISKPGTTFSASTIDRDANRLFDTGYFYDLYPTFNEVPEGVEITYHVLECPILTDVVIEGNSAIEPTEDLQKEITMQKGKRLNRRTLHDNIAAIQQKYVDDGYVMAKVNDLDVKDDGKLTIRINEGVLESIKVKGNTKTKDKVILREVRCKVGEPLNRNQVIRSYQRINNLGFFESVDIKPGPGVEPNAVALEIDVKEKNTGSFGIGAGYSTSDGLIGMLSLGDKNFRGTGDAVSISLEMSGDNTDSRGWSFSWTHPWIDHRETSMSLRVFNRTYEFDDYDTEGDLVEEYMRDRKGIEITFGRPHSEYSTNYVTLRNRTDGYNEHLSSSGYITGLPPASGTNTNPRPENWERDNFGLTRSIGYAHVTDTRDNYQWPTNGDRTQLSVEWAGFGGDFSFRKYEIDEARFRKVGHAQVLMIKGMYGYSRQDLPESCEFRVGGQDSIRGYRDNQFRGNAALTGTIEYRFPIVKSVKGAVFTDFGSAWDSGIRPRNLHGSYGFGVAIDTPVGPLRLDVGHGSQGNRVHFNIGTTF